MTAAANLAARNNEGVPVGVNVGNALQPAAGQVLTATSAVAASWQTPFISGEFLCAPTQYTPASQTVLTSSSTVMAAISSANINTGAFVAPTSGSVVVNASFVWGMGATAQFGAFGLSAHTIASTLYGNVTVAENNAQPAIANIPFLVAGLTPATSYNFDLLFAASTGSSTISVYAQGLSSTAPTATAAAPVTMTVRAV